MRATQQVVSLQSVSLVLHQRTCCFCSAARTRLKCITIAKECQESHHPLSTTTILLPQRSEAVSSENEWVGDVYDEKGWQTWVVIVLLSVSLALKFDIGLPVMSICQGMVLLCPKD